MFNCCLTPIPPHKSSLRHNTCNAGVVISIILSIFLTLAAFQKLPNRANVISNLGKWSQIGAPLLLGLSVIIYLVRCALSCRHQVIEDKSSKAESLRPPSPSTKAQNPRAASGSGAQLNSALAPSDGENPASGATSDSTQTGDTDAPRSLPIGSADLTILTADGKHAASGAVILQKKKKQSN